MKKIVLTLVPFWIFLYDGSWTQVLIIPIGSHGVMVSYTTTANNQVRCSYFHAVIRCVCGGLLLNSTIWISLPSSTWASVYKCIDQRGRSVLTNRKAGFQSCRVILEDAAGESKSGAGQKPKGLSQPTDDEMTPSVTDTPPPPTVFPNEPPMPWMNAPSSGGSSSSQPCAPGFNPLSPMSTPPCVQSDESSSSGTAPPR